MKNFWIIILCFCVLPVNGAVLTGGVEYSVDDAKIELQNNKPSSIDFILTNNNFVDSDREKNLFALYKGITKLNDRTLALFSDDSYGVIYNDDKKHVWYYKNDGTLMYAEEKASLEYPYRTYKYTPEGELVNMTMRVSEKETFIFDKLGNLLGHWIGENCYDENGNITMTRKILK